MKKFKLVKPTFYTVQPKGKAIHIHKNRAGDTGLKPGGECAHLLSY